MRKVICKTIVISLIALSMTTTSVMAGQQGQETSASADTATALKNHLSPWFITEQAQNPAVFWGNIDTSQKVKWIWDEDYLMNHPELTNGMSTIDYIIKKAVETKNPQILGGPSAYDSTILSELAGIPRTGNTDYYAVHGAKIDAEKAEVMKFLDSFPNWQSASDFEKAVKICNWIQQADYSTSNDDDYSSYGCLVNKKASCSGYTNAAILLAWAVNLPISQLGSINHTYPVFLVDGIWLSNEPTTKDKCLRIADVYLYNPLYEMRMKDGGDEAGVWKYQALGMYCEGVGYTIPTDPAVLDGIDGKYGTILPKKGEDGSMSYVSGGSGCIVPSFGDRYAIEFD